MTNFGSLISSISEENSLENRIFRLIKNEQQLKKEKENLDSAAKSYESNVQSVEHQKELSLDMLKHIHKSHDSLMECHNRITKLTNDIDYDKNEIRKYFEHVPGKKVRIVKRENYGADKQYLVWFEKGDIRWEEG